MGERKEPTGLPDSRAGQTPAPKGSTMHEAIVHRADELGVPVSDELRHYVEGGEDGRTRAERDMGLDIDPATGRAYTSQGDASNLQTGLRGRFHDGIMVPRSFRCEACASVVTERRFGEGFPNCGALGLNPGQYAFQRCGSLDLGPGGRFNLCGECIERMVNAVPQLAGLIAAMNGGKIRGRG